ncbi:PAS domain S-box protein [Cytobacillus depressus]|uniref:HTH-type transcriptional regulatory protein TyrR n=1 Tax=Cytobacillus depressus TaxID=1602942 RepID=A0A6L3V6Z1_9BACI|nr:sigma 54-interacting transcriptional regulator [Cytobacillus depressus]KAB2336232.1 PAS domain S-box protein [Cytobacillus depressus]
MNQVQAFLEFFPFPIILASSDGRIEYKNQVFSSLFKEEPIQDSLKELFDTWEDHGNQTVYVTLNQCPFLLIYQSITVESHEKWLYVLLDGTQIKRSQKKLRDLDNLNRELDAIIDNSYDAIYITDREGTALRTNSAIERITGIPEHYYIGKKVQYLIERGFLKESITFKVVEQKKTVSQIQKNYSGQETLSTGSPIFDENGEVEKVIINIRDLSELNELNRELKKALDLNDQYRKELEKLQTKTRQDPDMIVESKRMLDIYEMADRIADFDATVLILGETGVGKDVLVRHIYRASSRRETGEFIKINCGAIPHDLLESELFGYEAGAFTGANRTGKPGMFELAHKGVLFLDEVGELPLALQVKLLRVLQEKQIQRIGATKPINVDVRLIAATNRNLKKMVEKGEFREDLYYRLNVIPISIPPLRARKQDILPLVQYFLKKFNEKYHLSKEFDRGLKEFLYHYPWPGNVRELSNMVERLILTVPAKTLTVEDLPFEYQKKEDVPVPIHYTSRMTLKEATEIAEREILALAVQRYDSTYKMAEELGTSQSTIVRKLQKYNL